MKQKVAAVVAAVVLIGLGVAVAIGGSGEDPLVSKSYLEQTYPSAVAQTLENRASEGTKATYSQAVDKLDKLGEADVKDAESFQGAIDGYTPKTVNSGDVLTLKQGASMVVYSGGGTVSAGTLIDVTNGQELSVGSQKTSGSVQIASGHRYIASDSVNTVVRVTTAGSIGTQGTVTVTAAVVPEVDGLPFSDIKNGDWYLDAVRFVYEKGYFSGTAEGVFSPNTSMTRAMLATVLHRASNLEEPGEGAEFGDVGAGLWYSNGIAWASQRGIVNGMGDGNYHPDRAVTREELVTMLYRYQSYRKGSVSAKKSLSGYPDGGAVADWAKGAMEWAVGAGLVQGRDTGHLDPKGTATRAEVATILQRFEALK